MDWPTWAQNIAEVISSVWQKWYGKAVAVAAVSGAVWKFIISHYERKTLRALMEEGGFGLTEDEVRKRVLGIPIAGLKICRLALYRLADKHQAKYENGKWSYIPPSTETISRWKPTWSS
jgi:hypothetical protein